MPKSLFSPRGACLLLAVLGLALLAAPAARACPYCADNLSTASNGNAMGTPGAPALQSPALARGFYYSILLMVFVPYLVLGGLGFYIWRMYKTYTAAMQEADEDPSVPSSPQAQPV